MSINDNEAVDVSIKRPQGLIAVDVSINRPQSLFAIDESINRPQGLFIQASTSNTWVLPHLNGWLENICAKNLLLPPNQRINDIILQDVAVEQINTVNGMTSNYTMLYDVLDVIVPYLPGGSKQCFGNVFVGTVEAKWNGGGDYYFDAVQNEEFRERFVRLSQQVALEIINKYPQMRPIHWYITYESNLNYLIDENCMRGYLKLLSNAVCE